MKLKEAFYESTIYNRFESYNNEYENIIIQDISFKYDKTNGIHTFKLFVDKESDKLLKIINKDFNLYWREISFNDNEMYYEVKFNNLTPNK